MSIHCFLSDTALHLKPLSGNVHKVVLAPNEVNQNVGFLDDNTYNYFNTPAGLSDPRDTRLQILTGGRANGEMLLYFDADRLGLTLEAGETSNDLAPRYFAGVATNEFTKLFNIMEAIYYSQDSSQSALDTILTNGTSAYGIYTAGSLVLSEPVRQATVNILGTEGATTVSAYLRKWAYFTVTLHSVAIEFCVWLDAPAFQQDYPFSTITKIVYPCDPAQLLDNSFANVIEAIVGAAGYIDSAVGTEVASTDHNGTMTITSNYANNQYSTFYAMPFSVMYKGVAPSAQQVRDAVRINLLAKNLATEDVWKALLPDLFANNGFYIVPIWDNTVGVNTLTLFSGVINHKDIVAKVIELYPELNATDITNHLAIFKCMSGDVFLAAIPYPTNSNETQSLNAVHPTYQTISASDNMFLNQVASTQEFNININDGISILNGGANTNQRLTPEVVDGKTYLSFVTDFIEYRILNPVSFSV